MELGKLGVWYSFDGYELPQAVESAQRIEALGYSALWHPMSLRRDVLLVASSLLAGTEKLIVATGIATIYERQPALMAAGQRTLAEQSNGRFLLGLGVSHPLVVEGMWGLEYGPPLTMMREYLEKMDAGIQLGALGVPRDQGRGPDRAGGASGLDAPRVLAALGPKMLELAREKSQGAHPYLMPPEHTRRAREILGPDRWLCVELKVVLESDPSKARVLARQAGLPNTTLHNYQKTWKQLGFDDSDFRDGGSDRLIDATIAWGPLVAIEKHIQAHFDAGASHVCIQPVNPSGRQSGLHWDTLEALAGSSTAG